MTQCYRVYSVQKTYTVESCKDSIRGTATFFNNPVTLNIALISITFKSKYFEIRKKTQSETLRLVFIFYFKYNHSKIEKYKYIILQA